MIWLDVLVGLILAFIFASVIVSIAARGHDTVWPGRTFYFVILFLAIWAARTWLEPVAWPGWGWHLLAMAAIGMVLMLAMLATLTPQRPGYGGSRPRPDPDAAVSNADMVMAAEAARANPEVAQYSYGLMFWLLVIALVGSIVAGMVTPAR